MNKLNTILVIGASLDIEMSLYQPVNKPKAKTEDDEKRILAAQEKREKRRRLQENKSGSCIQTEDIFSDYQPTPTDISRRYWCVITNQYLYPSEKIVNDARMHSEK